MTEGSMGVSYRKVKGIEWGKKSPGWVLGALNGLVRKRKRLRPGLRGSTARRRQPASAAYATVFHARQTDMEQDDLIFLGAAVLLGQMASQRPPEQSEIKSAVSTARNLRDEVERQHEEARAKKEVKKP
jgi:hypothetical protein